MQQIKSREFSRSAPCMELVPDVGKLGEITCLFGNVGSIITFRVGTDDAERLAEQLGKCTGQNPNYVFSERWFAETFADAANCTLSQIEFLRVSGLIR